MEYNKYGRYNALCKLKIFRIEGFVMHITYRPEGVCSQLFEIDIENDRIEKVEVKGGCSGNLQGISRLLVGMTPEEAAAKLEGIRCGYKKTSCPDQIAKALKKCIKKE